MGLRVILDGVFNHSGDRFWAFQDIRTRKQGSVYKDWYVITGWEPFQYEGWAGFGGLPVYREDGNGLNQGIAEHIFHITRRWMDPNQDGDPSDGIDGWRLDVPNEVQSAFWRKWRILVKGINKDAFITGEIWENAKSWLKGDEFDSVMNYEFTKLLYRFFIHARPEYKISPSKLDQGLQDLLQSYPMQVNLVLQNLLDSHDTDRILSGIRNPDRDFDSRNRLQENDPYDSEKPGEKEVQIFKLIQVFQFTFPGSPMIYYGDEAGLWGADDPNNRMPMIWKDIDLSAFREDILVHTRKMAGLRNRFKALREGTYSPFLLDDKKDIFSFIRKHGDQILYVILNNSVMSQEIKLPIRGRKIRDILNDKSYTGNSGEFTVSLKPKYGALFILE
ncbi:MAG: alpha-amylase family glycosyl hydrolase [bacterium]|nr:alpha-amylase family glycosyl hydrolase [bacterium]